MQFKNFVIKVSLSMQLTNKKLFEKKYFHIKIYEIFLLIL